MRPWMIPLLTAIACNEGDPGGGPNPPSGDRAWVSCDPYEVVDYKWGCGYQDEDGECHPDLGVCFAEEDGSYGGTYGYCYEGPITNDDLFLSQLEDDCVAQCDDAVRDQACDAWGRYAENISGCASVLTTYRIEDCTTGTELRRALGVTWTPATGAPTTVTGAVLYTLDTRTRTGRLRGLSIDVPLALTVAERTASTLLGFAAGTEISVRSVSLVGSVPFTLDSRSRATLRGGTVMLEADVTIEEPGELPRAVPLYAVIPWNLVITATSTSFTFDRVADGLGGTFAPTGGR
jgi:hypothetical protein